MIHLQEDIINVNVVLDQFIDEEQGGYCLFDGRVRSVNKGEDIDHLFFEAHASMALKEMQKIVDKCIAKFGIENLAIVHRLGKVLPGESAVLIIARNHHRTGIFESVYFAINELKSTVPIWKKEVLQNGEYWVSAYP
ncbi:MAG: molybdenum cofactor biosynthesis protein MoaE [Flavobacteriales bacterium]|nr:molybdenum cofactor biosynthesis protein MoaE [Flavobacteriales bacterium]